MTMSQFTMDDLREKTLNYAVEKKLFTSLEDVSHYAKAQFSLTLGMHGQIPKGQPFSVDDVIIENEPIFMDWYLFEREPQYEKTIAEMYAESDHFKRDFPGVEKKVVQKLREPVWTYFAVCEKGENNEYTVQDLEKGKMYLIHDESTFSFVEKRNVIFAKLYPLGDTYYISGDIKILPEEFLTEFEKMKAFQKRLEELFEEFLESKNVKEKTKRKYEEMFSVFSSYVAEKGYKTMEKVRKVNIDSWIRWVRKEWGTSSYKEDEYRSAVKQFLMYLEGK